MVLSRHDLDPLRIDPDEAGSFRLADHDPAWLPHAARDLTKDEQKQRGSQLLEESKQELAEVQDRLYADDRYALLLVFQAMDAAGKDGTIKHVMSGVNPQGCQVVSFKQPSSTELDHDFLWRCAVALPERGRIGIFNRSYYEEVLVTRVHPEILDAQRLPSDARGKDFWQHRYDSINAFERHLARNGTVICKFFLNVSKDEQRQRFLDRLDDPAKNWKFSASDLKERLRWDDYMAAYEHAIRHTSTAWAPWYVIPADRKWAMRAAVAGIIVHTLAGLDLRYPEVGAAQQAALAEAKAELEAEIAAEHAG